MSNHSLPSMHFYTETCTVEKWLKINQNSEYRIPPTDIFTAILPSSFHVAYAMQTNGMHFACFACFLSMGFHASLLLHLLCAIYLTKQLKNDSREIVSQKILLEMVITVIAILNGHFRIDCKI